MANTSIETAFERMWQNILTKIDVLLESGGVDIDNITDKVIAKLPVYNGEAVDE